MLFGKGFRKSARRHGKKDKADRAKVQSSGIEDLLIRHENTINYALVRGWISRDEALSMLGQMNEIRMDAVKNKNKRSRLNKMERKEYQTQLREQLMILRGRKR